MTDDHVRRGLQAFKDAEHFAGLAATHEDLVYVEENYRIAFNDLKDSPVPEHRRICAQCLEAVARILDGEGRRDAGNDLRQQAEAYRKPHGPDSPGMPDA